MPPTKTSGLSLVKLVIVGGRFPPDAGDEVVGDCVDDGACTVTQALIIIVKAVKIAKMPIDVR